eukprot:219516-Chlamydomonas_euryale.AAC.1
MSISGTFLSIDTGGAAGRALSVARDLHGGPAGWAAALADALSAEGALAEEYGVDGAAAQVLAPLDTAAAALEG